MAELPKLYEEGDGMTEYNVERDGCMAGVIFCEAGQWLFDDGHSTEEFASIREYTKGLEHDGYTVTPTALGGLTQGGGA